MPAILFADNFLAGSLLTLLMPTLLLSAIAVWYVRTVRRVPENTPPPPASLPAPDVLAAADAVAAQDPPTEPPPAGEA